MPSFKRNNRGFIVEIGFECPICGTTLTSPQEDAGSSIPCPVCNERLKVPGKHEVEQDRLAKQQTAPREVQVRQAAQTAKLAYASKGTPKPNVEVPSPFGLQGMLSEGETIAATIGRLTLTTRKLIWSRKPKSAMLDSVVLPLTDINYVRFGNNRGLGILLMILGGLAVLVGGIQSVTKSPDAGTVFLCLVLATILLVVGFLVFRQKTMVFSANGGTLSFIYVFLFFMSTDGISHVSYVDDATYAAFVKEFFRQHSLAARERRPAGYTPDEVAPALT